MDTENDQVGLLFQTQTADLWKSSFAEGFNLLLHSYFFSETSPKSQSALLMYWSLSSPEKSNRANIISFAKSRVKTILPQMGPFLSQLSGCGSLITAHSPNYKVYFEHIALFLESQWPLMISLKALVTGGCSVFTRAVCSKGTCSILFNRSYTFLWIHKRIHLISCWWIETSEAPKNVRLVWKMGRILLVRNVCVLHLPDAIFIPLTLY